MKKFIYLFTLFALCISLTIAHAASPTYDDEPPSYIWGSGGLNAQTSGTPNKSGEDRIVDAINAQGASITSAITNQNVNVGSISVDTSAIESYLRVGDGQTATTTVTDLINSIGTDTSNIESHLKTDTGSSVIKTVAEMLLPIYRMFYDGGDGSTSAFGLMCNDISEIYQLLNDSSPTVTTISDKLKSIQTSTNTIIDTITPKYYRTQRCPNIAPNTETVFPAITPTSADDHGTVRVFVELRAIDPSAEFYIGFDNTVTDSTGRPVKGRILLNMGDNMEVFVYHTNASSIQIQQTEGWR